MPRQPSNGGSFRSEVLSGAKTPGLIASARNFKTDPIKSTNRLSRIQVEDWQKLAWQFFDTVTEYHYSVTVVANLLSRAKLYVTKDGKPTDDAKAVAILAELAGGPTGQTELLRQYGIHFTVAGDSYLVGMERDGKSDWFVAAASEITERDGNWKVGTEELQPSDLVIRAWRAHPQKRQLPDSPTRAALPILAEIDGLTKHVAAQIDSRLQGAGILFIPEEMNIGRAPQPVTTTGAAPEVEEVVAPTNDLNSASDLMMELLETASASLQNPGDASSLVPIVIQVKGDTIANVKHLKFWTELDQHAIELRTEAIRRLALGMDMPPETLMGTSDSNHWNAWQSEEASIKSHAEPLLYAVTDALSIGYLRPNLELDPKEAARYAIAADTTEMRLRPNRSKEALELFNIGALSVEAVVRENGFSLDDMMTDDEKKIWLLQKVASGSTTPQLVAEALIGFGVPGITMPTDAQDGTEARPTPSIAEHPTRDLPDQESSEAIAASLVAPAYMMVDRALERAGNRLRTELKGVRVRDAQGGEVAAVDTYRFVRIDYSTGLLDRLLDDAWAQCDRFASTFGVDGAWLQNALDTYTRDLLQHAGRHDARTLETHLALTAATRPERIKK